MIHLVLVSYRIRLGTTSCNLIQIGMNQSEVVIAGYDISECREPLFNPLNFD